MVPGPAARLAPGNLSEMQTLQLRSREEVILAYPLPYCAGGVGDAEREGQFKDIHKQKQSTDTSQQGRFESPPFTMVIC